MKRILGLCLGIALLSSLATAQSLGEIARKQRQQKKPATAKHVITNDDLAKQVVFNNGAASGPASDKPADASDKKPADAGAATAEAPADKAKLVEEWRAKLDEQKKAIALLERELDVMQREYKMRIATYYADAGNKFRDERAWAEQDGKYQADIAAKQKDLDAARQKLDGMKEAARKAGVPSGQID